LHAGWNYNKWENAEEYPAYQYYRFHGNVAGGCKFNEITFVGVETIQNEANKYTCDVKAVVGETEIELNTV
jgi:hypothetical protein